MRPALYYPWVYLKGGAERVLLELMTRSSHDWTLYTNRFEPQATYPEFSDLRVETMAEISVRRNLWHVSRAGLTLVTQKPPFDRHDALIIVSEGLGNLMAARSAVPTSCVCLTPLKVVYDTYTNEQFFAGTRRPSRRAAYRAAFWGYERVDRPTWRHYRRVFCNSHEVRARLLRAGLVEAERLEVAYHGVDTQRWHPAGRRERTFLVPGRIMWQKNIDLALEAWRRFQPRPGERGFRLLVAGMVDRKSEPYLQGLRARAADRPDVEFVVSPSDSELLDLYQRCWAVVFPALNEDWGLVPLEAMACGKPVLATDRGGPKESVVEGVSGFLRVDHPHFFAEAMGKLAALSEGELGLMARHCRDRAVEFPWESFVGRIDDHIEELASAPSTDRMAVATEAPAQRSEQVG